MKLLVEKSAGEYLPDSWRY